MKKIKSETIVSDTPKAGSLMRDGGDTNSTEPESIGSTPNS